jgi:hypothetical protein
MGRAIAQVVSRRLPTATARFRTQVKSCSSICGGQSGIDVGFLRVLQFLLSVLIPKTAPHSSSSIFRSWCNSKLAADVTRGHSLTPPEEAEKKFFTIGFIIDCILLPALFTHSVCMPFLSITLST